MPDRSAHILLVEDDPSIRDLMTTVFEDEGYAVTTCVSPQQAVPLLDLSSFDLVITDDFSARSDFIMASIAEVIRSAGLTPVMLSSAHTLDVAAALAAGFCDLITKPFDLDTVVRQIEALLAPVPAAAAASGRAQRVLAVAAA